MARTVTMSPQQEAQLRTLIDRTERDLTDDRMIDALDNALDYALEILGMEGS